MPLGTEVGLGPGDIVLDGEPTPLPKRGQSFPILWIKICTWHGSRPQPRRLCVRWGPSPLPKKGGEAPSAIFGPFLLWTNGWMHQDATWYGGRPQLRGLCVRYVPIPLPKKGAEPPSKNRPMFIVAKGIDGSRRHLAWR